MISIFKLVILALQVPYVISTNIAARGCLQDSCYRALSRKIAAASAFCATYTTDTVVATTGLPTFIPTACYPPARLSSACFCNIIPTSKTSTSTTGSRSASVSTSTTSSGSASASGTTTLSGSTGACVSIVFSTVYSTYTTILTSTSYAEALVTVSSTTTEDLTSTSYAEALVTVSSTTTEDLTSTSYVESVVTLLSTITEDLTSTSYAEAIVTSSSTLIEEFTTSVTTTVFDTLSGAIPPTSSTSILSDSSTSTTSTLPSTTSSTTIASPICSATSGPPAALYQISTSPATTQTDCATFCSLTEGCLSYALDATNPGNTICLALSGTVSQWEITGQSTVTGWDSGCAVTTDLTCNFSGLATFGATLTPTGILAPFAHLCTSICNSYTTANPSTPCLSWSYSTVNTLCYLYVGTVTLYNPPGTTNGDIWSDAACTAVPFPSGPLCAFPVDASAAITGGVTMLALGTNPATSVQACQMTCSMNIDPVTQLIFGSFSWDSAANTCLCYDSNVGTIDPPYLSTSSLELYDASCSLPALPVCSLAGSQTSLTVLNLILPLSPAPNILWCYNSCLMLSSCLSYSYDGTTCVHYKAGVSAMGVVLFPQYGLIFSDIACPSPPSQPTCNYLAAGLVPGPAQVGFYSVTTSDQCVTHCLQTSGCLSWSWNVNLVGVSKALNCFIYTKNVMALNPSNSIAAMNMWVYWDIGCSCGFEGNLAINSAESGTVGLVHSAVSYEACLALQVQIGTWSSCSWSAGTGACIGYKYWLEDPRMVLTHNVNSGLFLGDLHCP